MLETIAEQIKQADSTYLLMKAFQCVTERLRSKKCSFRAAPITPKSYHEYEAFRGDAVSVYTSPKNFDYGLNTSIWYELRSQNGELFATQSARLEELVGTLGEFLPRQLQRIYGNLGEDCQPLSVQTNPALNIISGRCVYHADLFLGKSAQKLGVLEPFCQAALIHAFMKFSHEYSWCYLRDKNIKRGLASQVGMAHQYPHAFLFHETPSYRDQDDWIAFSDKRDVRHLAASIVLFDELERNKSLDAVHCTE